MRYRYFAPAVAAVLLCILFACGGNTARSALAEDMDRVASSLTELPSELSGELLLARTGSIVVREDGALYEVRSGAGAYYQLQLPLDGTWTRMALSPDGGIWAVVQTEDSLLLVKLGSQYTLLSQTVLEQQEVTDLVCDSAGRVFLATDNGRIQRWSAQGEPEGSVTLPYQAGELQLVADQDRVFAAYRSHRRGVWNYAELSEDMTLGQSFPGCVEGAEVRSAGAFLEGYTVMEHDSVGLYACREDGVWETVCLWSDLHLDGNIQEDLINDAQGRAVTRYMENGVLYALTLREK